MAIKISDLVITSDIDGTLLHAPNPIPARNIQAIERFTQKGGRFAIASGRSIESARQYIDQLPINAPCIVFNGSGIYDYSTDQLLYASYLPHTYREYIKEILLHFPEIGAVLLSQKDMHSVADMHYVQKYLGMENQQFIESHIDMIEDDLFKVILSMDEETIFRVQSFVNTKEWNDVEFVRSSPYFFEMLPFGCNKGTGLVHLTSSMGISLEQTVSIGDYYNDFEMLKTTPYPVTVKGAPNDIKSICKLVVGECRNGALADLIEHLEDTYPVV